jgi:copper chaperone
MFNLFNKKSLGEVVTFKIDGLHCVSCSLNIDGTLEDTNGVISAQTSYAKGRTKIIYQADLIGKNELKKIIESLNYKVVSD